MKNIVIAGTGGLASEITTYIEDNISFFKDVDYKIKGYLDINDSNWERYKLDYPLIGSENDFLPEDDDYFVVGVGIHKLRNKIIDVLAKKNAKFFNFVHHSSIISKTSCLGFGNIIAPNCIIGPNVKIGNNNIVNYFCSFGHDVIIGDNNIFSPNNHLTGFVKVGNNNFFGTSVSVVPSITICDFNKIHANTTIVKNIKSNCFIYSENKNKEAYIHQTPQQ